MPRPSKAPRNPVLPCPVPRGVTHFWIRKPGRNGEIMTFNDRGVLQKHHPISWFDRDEIRTRWGYSADYWVHFSRLKPDGKRMMIGSPKQIGILDPHEPPRSGHVGDLAPGDGSGSGELGSLEAVTRVLGLVDSRTTPAIEAAQRAADRNVGVIVDLAREFASTARQNGERLQEEVRTLRTELASMQRRHLAETEELRASLERRRRREPEPIDPDEDDEEEESTEPSHPLTDAERMRELATRYREDGPAAVLEFLEETAAMEAFRFLPQIVAKMPELVTFLKPKFQEFMSLLDRPVAPVEAPAPVPIVVERVEVPRPRKKHVRPVPPPVDATPIEPGPNAMRSPPVAPPPEDEYTTRVS
jgi:hypothetical protein